MQMTGREVVKAKEKSYSDLYVRLDTKAGEKGLRKRFDWQGNRTVLERMCSRLYRW